MDSLNILANAISSIGFPILAYLLMFKQVQSLQKSHEEEISKLTETLNNNTIAINNLVQKLDEKDVI